MMRASPWPPPEQIAALQKQMGGKLPNLTPGDGVFWSVNDNFCVPDSVYDPATNPDGKQKLAKLVQMCQALRDACAAYCIPLSCRLASRPE